MATLNGFCVRTPFAMMLPSEAPILRSTPSSLSLNRDVLFSNPLTIHPHPHPLRLTIQHRVVVRVRLEVRVRVNGNLRVEAARTEERSQQGDIGTPEKQSGGIQGGIGIPTRTDRQSVSQRRHLPPITVTLDPQQIQVPQLIRLMDLAQYSPYAFPTVHPEDTSSALPEDIPRVSPEDEGSRARMLRKLRRALNHSTVVVGLLIKAKALESDYMAQSSHLPDIPPPSNTQLLPFSSKEEMRLVAFARASSDCSLTAAIHDVVVHPELQGLGLGRRVLQRMLRELQAFGTGDISLLCSPDQCSYFKGLGFDSDRMHTRTMMYVRQGVGGKSNNWLQNDAGTKETLAWGGKLLQIPLEAPSPYPIKTDPRTLFEDIRGLGQEREVRASQASSSLLSFLHRRQSSEPY